VICAPGWSRRRKGEPLDETHTALAKAMPGLRRFEAARGIRSRTAARSPTSASPSSRSTTSPCGHGLGRQDGQAAVNDIPNLATGGVTIFFAEID
jgi:hypothetical protein